MAHPKHDVISEIIARHKSHHGRHRSHRSQHASPHVDQETWVEREERCHATDDKANRRSKCTVDALKDILGSTRSTAAERLEIQAWLKEHDPEYARGAAL